MNRTANHTSTHAHAAPSWFRYGVIALAVAVLCSCRASGPEYRVAAGPDGTAVAETFDAIRAPGDEAQSSPPSQPTQFASDSAHPHLDNLVTPVAYTTDDVPVSSDQYPTAGCQLGPDGCYVNAGNSGVPCGPDGCPVGGCPTGTCGPDGCACCGPDGLRGPSDEYLCDGGDFGSPAAVLRSGNVVGLESEDAIAHYETVDGRTVVTPSNKVCIYAPRFAAVREVVDLRALTRIDAAHGEILDQGPARLRDSEKAAPALAEIEPNIHRVRTPPSLLREREQAGELDRDRRVAVTLGEVAPYANLTIIRTGEVVGTDIVKLARSSLAAITWAGDQAAQVVLDSREAVAEVGVKTPGTIYLLIEPNNPKLRLIKCASTDAAHPGEEVEFTLRFDNVGDRVIGNVTILDSLTTRLEYIDGSQKCSMKAEFDTRANDGSSLKLRWQIQEPIKRGEGGVIQFRCRVR